MMESENWMSYIIAEQSLGDQKDKERLYSALKDKTLQLVINPDRNAKKLAYVKASKQHYVGMIVGKKGSNIMQKRNQTNTDVQNPQQDDEPTFRVTGDNYQDLLEMSLWILRQDDRLSGKDSNNDSHKIEAKIWCCSKYVGLLVGPNGETIRQIKETSRCCSIQSPPRNEKIKCFAVTGSYEEINVAFDKMQELIEKKFHSDKSSYINSFKTCDCINPCERLRLLDMPGMSPSQQQLEYISTNYHPQQTFPPIAPFDRVTYPYNPHTDHMKEQQSAAAEYMLLEQGQHEQVMSMRQPINQFVHKPSHTIQGSRVFSGRGSSSSSSSSHGSPRPTLTPASINELDLLFAKMNGNSVLCNNPLERDLESLYCQFLVLQLSQNQENMKSQQHGAPTVYDNHSIFDEIGSSLNRNRVPDLPNQYSADVTDSSRKSDSNISSRYPFGLNLPSF